MASRFQIFQDPRGQEPFSGYTYSIYDSTRLIGRFWHDYRGDENELSLFCAPNSDEATHMPGQSMSHPFLLVLHFPPESPLTSADTEDDIADAIGNPRENRNADHIVDGNEIGDSIDIFVSTREPTVALELCVSAR